MRRSRNSSKAYERMEALKQELRKEELSVALSKLIEEFNNDTANSCVVSNIYYKEDTNDFSIYFGNKPDQEDNTEADDDE